MEEISTNIIHQHRQLPVFESLFKQYYAALCAFAFEFVNRHELAEEIVQDTFVKIWERYEELDIQVSEKAYLYRAVQNNCLNFIKQDKIKAQYGSELMQQLESRISLLGMSSFHSPVEKLEHSELELLAEKAIRKLPPQCQDVFRLSRFEQLSYPEISHRLGISINTVKTQMTRALQRLRAELLPLLK
ncbi:RNA polymerase sigma-70 factor [Chitinophaga nivalis]|uniref:RNA polymerase sigma-70 factor n=1 Tax=Chitinophaga nivalis TaxID=2991709 RepID=A0ABT3IVL3_9BACT|nr:RNA polymerase sigma-70 factor [Chitinophaga nivalis]MCW3462294.1 RNA polymerase sigma-70 factor [Chitinophaga nivalis]MCW3488015.1 RNA polymerase sigma-70 factor [Chitinophaga nivalis]